MDLPLWMHAVVWGFAALVALAAYRAMTYEEAPAPHPDARSPEAQFRRAKFLTESEAHRRPRFVGTAPVGDLEWRHPRARVEPTPIVPRQARGPSVDDLVARDPEIVALLESLAATDAELREAREARERRAARPGLLGTDVIAEDGGLVGIREM